MMILPLTENALFMRFWHPQGRRQRFVPIVAFYAVLVISAMMTCYLALLYNPDGDLTWPQAAFVVVVGLEALVLLIIGSYAVGARSFEESTTRALDFHRASPTPAADQAVGLLFGPAALAWICFAVGVPAVFLCAALANIPMAGAASAVVSLTVTGLFFHLLSGAVGLSLRRSSARSTLQGSPIGIVIVLIIGSSMFTAAPFPLAAFVGSVPVVVDAVEANNTLRTAFLGLTLPVLLTQVILQLPLMAVAALAMVRAIRYPERPAISKRMALVLAGWLLFLYVAAIVPPKHDWRDYRLTSLIAGTLFAMVVGACLVAAVTPRYALFCAGLRRRREGLLDRRDLLDDSAGNSAWCFLFIVAALVFYAALSLTTGPGPLVWLPPVALVLYFGWLAQSLEYFRLRPEKRRGPVFPLLLIVLWVILPVMGVIAAPHDRDLVPWAGCLMSTCPLFGIVISGLVGTRDADDIARSMYIITFAVNSGLFVLFACLAAVARQKIARQIESQMASKSAAPG